ncbi:sensor histidine kinase [Actinomadura hibisca]|uniref:sensor histidine kinase n=1 Tax=Actinomadura hibisca TaxID=68565 RepID=UPI001FDF8274|nr:HAMP domain-containing sensor histidine kinase [Actinomadura hibisca]
MRARTTLAATAVVAAALVAAGVAVVLLLRAGLTGRAGLQAEVTAREVASRIASGTPYDRLDLPDAEDHPVQVVDAAGRVRAAGSDLRSLDGVARPPAEPADNGDDDDDDETRPGQVSSKVRMSTGTADVDGDTTGQRFAALEVTAPSGETLTVYAGAPLDAQREAVGTVTRTMLVGLPLLLLVVAAVTWLVTRRALRPVAAIRAELAEITAAGDLARRVPVPRSKDEVAALAATTNTTLAALERSVARQRDFVADASHELRSPIASLRTELEVAQAHPELLDVDGLAAEVVRLQHLAADLLLLARLDAGDRPAEPRPVDLADLVREEAGRRPGVAAVVEASPQVAGSRGQLARVLGNLLDNAVRHADRYVRVELSESGGTAVIRVTDDGPGVPPADRERIFERFVRLDAARGRDDGGAGLGLPIARDLVEAHGGTLAAGAAPGGGALLEARLPTTRRTA